MSDYDSALEAALHAKVTADETHAPDLPIDWNRPEELKQGIDESEGDR